MLEAQDLSVTRSGRLVLEDINFSITKGEFVGIVGPNGGGKSTLLLTILGILQPSKGSVHVFGYNPKNVNFNGKVGWVSQTAASIPTKMRMTVKELISLGTISTSDLFSFRRRRNDEAVERALELVGLTDLADMDIGRLSGGQRQRAVIGRALASNAELLIFDEPLVNVDRSSRNGILKLLDDLCHNENKTLLMVSHDLTAIRQSAHRVIYLDGQIQYDGKPSEIPDLSGLAGLIGLQHVHALAQGGRMMQLSEHLVEILSNVLEPLGPLMPGETFPAFFELEMFQRALIAAILTTIVAGFYGSFLLMKNLALMGDGLAHVSFGGVAVGIVLGATAPLWYALVFSLTAALIIHELQERELLTGDASIAIFLTGMLALGLVVLRIWGGGITSDIEGYLFGNLLLIDYDDLDLILYISIFSLVSLFFLHDALLATTIDAIAARIQGIPTRWIGLWFSAAVAAIVVSMVQVVGTLLVTALLVTPAATAQLVGRSFRSCMILTQVFGLISVILGLYFSAELETGSGSMIALISAIVFAIVLIGRSVLQYSNQPKA